MYKCALEDGIRELLPDDAIILQWLARWADRAYLSARPGVDTHILDGEPVVVRRGGDVLGLDKAGNVESNLLLTCRYGRTLSQSTSK